MAKSIIMNGANCLRCVAVAGLLALGATPAMADSATNQVTVTSVRPATLVKESDLDFGLIISGSTPGTVKVDVNTGARTATGGVTLAGSTAQRAEFTGGGVTGLLMTVNRPSSVTLTRVGGGAPNMTASLDWTLSGAGLNLFGLYLINQPTQVHRAGGTLTVPANQPGGTYTGTFTLTVNYL